MKTSTMKAMNLILTILVGMGILLGSPSMSNAAEKPKPGGTFVVGLHADPNVLNPIITTMLQTKNVLGNIFSQLIYCDLHGNYVGDLAEKWTISKDNLTTKFDLRKEAKWHDGRPVTAEDVKFSLESLAKYHPRTMELRRISEIRVLGPYSLEVKFPSPSILFFPLLDDSGFIIPKHIYGSGDLNTHPANNNPIGSGPFIFQEWKKNDHITLIKNKDYYISGEPFVDKAIFKIIPSGISRVLALETGDVDYLCERALPDTDVARFRNNPNFVVTEKGIGSSSLQFLFFNTKRKPWDDIRVRQAVAYAIDRQIMVEKGTFGLTQPAYSPFSKVSWPWAYNPKVEAMYPIDLAKAAKLLDEAGYPVGSDGVRFKTTITFDRGDSRTMDITEIFRVQLKKVGIDIVMQPTERAIMSDRVWMNADFDLWHGSISQGTEPSMGIERLFTKEGIPPIATSHNVSEYRNPEVDRLFSLATATIDLEKRGQYYREVQPILMRDLPVIPLIDNVRFAAFSKKVRGVHERRFMAYHHSASDAWFSQ